MSIPSSGSAIRWLHLTDLHVGRDSETQKTALAALIRAVDSFAKDKPFDFVFLTGDLAYSGHPEEYNRLYEHLIGPLKSHKLFENAIFFSVPGNHDLDCSVGYPPSWTSLGKSRQEQFFRTDEKGTQTRSGRSGAFSAYANFIKAANLTSPDPTTDPAKMVTLNIRGRSVTVICLVTCFFSDKETADKGKAPMPTHPLRSLLQDAPPSTASDPIIVLGHHPSQWFTQESDMQFRSVLFDQNAIYLHGHEHVIQPQYGGRGLRALGFGAAYQASLEATPTPYYRNSFAICELTTALHVSIVSWDSEHGQWRHEQRLPADFCIPSDVLERGYRLELPTTPIAAHQSSLHATIASAVRSEVQFASCIWLVQDHIKRWTDFLIADRRVSQNATSYSLPHQALPAGHVEFRIKSNNENYLVRAISAAGDVLNYEQLQSINTILDTQDYDGCLVVTLGTLAKDAEKLAVQLSSRKSIEVLQKTEIFRGLMRQLTQEQTKTILETNPDAVSASLIATDKGIAVLLQDQRKLSWFTIISEIGKALLESSDLVRRICEHSPTFARLSYRSTSEVISSGEISLAESNEFDQADYLHRSHDYFDDVRYAPLAAIGLKFNKASLSEMYVAPSADVGGTTKSSQNLNRAVAEYLDSLGLPKAQRDQIETQLRSRFGLERSAEVGAASALYRRYNNVVVLGDPGSGKTCFVKHEILSYCKASTTESSWYSNHLPVYVPLAEAARLYDEQPDILDICETLSSRRGIQLPRKVIERALENGQVAFFFDGLDEVGLIDKRISLMHEVGKLAKTYVGKGNRFVLASRPAAVQPVDIPESFTYIQLKGLTEDEMRVLAGRVMTARLGENESDRLDNDENALIERLLDDTRSSPGIARIARNPLLLTLLVLIYANTGALSAKRHLIYSQAIKTLVSVRGRQTRERQISEADLRTRLGALGVAIFSREIAEIPKRAEVQRVLIPFLGRGRATPEGGDERAADCFLQEVAEATGLLSIHQGEKGASEDLVTFMHYSFLEYYTAAGLLARDFVSILPKLSRNPRWRDVTTLLFGILSDQSDVTSTLERLMTDETPSESITKHKLLLALDCASECDIPPEATQDLLADEVFNVMSSGVGRYSADFREKLAEKLQYLLQAVAPRIERAFIQGLHSEEPHVIAAFLDLVARLDNGTILSSDLTDAVTSALVVDSSSARAAALLAIERHPELRSAEATALARKCLKGSLVEKHAALKALAAVPEYHSDLADEVESLLDDSNPLVSESAAQCLLARGLQRGGAWQDDERLREKVLAKLYQSDQDVGFAIEGVTIQREVIDAMLASENGMELAIRYMPLVQDDDYVYRALNKALRQARNGRAKAACMDSLRLCQSARGLVTIGDTDLFCSFVGDGERNVRLAAVKLLGELPDDEQVVKTLQAHMKHAATINGAEVEVTETARALSKHVRRNPALRNKILKEVLAHLPRSASDGFGDGKKQHHLYELLSICEVIGGTDDAMAQRLLRLADDFRVPEPIRKQSLRVFGRIATPTEANVRALQAFLAKNDNRLKESVYTATHSFVRQCRGKVEYVRRVYAALDGLRVSLCTAWRRETAGVVNTIDPSGAGEIRAALIEIDNLTAAYQELAEQTKT